MDWNHLKVFFAVTEIGSFSGTARALGMSQSAISRQILNLEEDMGAILFRRTPSGLELTEPGEELRAAVDDMSSRAALATQWINEFRETPEGPLKITTSVAFGSAWLSARISRFLKAYPDISVSLLLIDNVELDLKKAEANVAIRFRLPEQQDLIQRKLMDVRYHIFASKEYLDEYGTPKTAADLDDHKILVYGEDFPAPIDNINWLLTVGREEKGPRVPILTVNSIQAIVRAVMRGVGIAALPYYLSEEYPELVEILGDLNGPNFSVYFVYPEEMRNAKRINVLRDFLLAEVDEDRKNRKC